MKIVLVSTYELGRQPFGLASAAVWLRSAGHEVSCADLSVDQVPEDRIRAAGLVAFYLPMHTATVLALKAIAGVKRLNPEARLCGFGLYAPLSALPLREAGVEAILGGEFEPDLVRLADGLVPDGPEISLERLKFQAPDRSGLPRLDQYAHLRYGSETRVAGYTEASRGCKHLCRHCPIVPVYNGAFRVVQREIVLEDVRRQVAAGAQHITFGDPDFWNGPAHAMRIVEELHREFPEITYDATIKIEHLRRHREFVPALKETGCLFVTSAVESLDDAVLRLLDKGHTRRDFEDALADLREHALPLAPTFIPFTPWTSVESYRDFLRILAELDLVDSVSPVQLALRLLIPAGSRLLELAEVRTVVTGYDAPALLHRWAHADPAVDALAGAAMRLAARKEPRRELFRRFWEMVHGAKPLESLDLVPRAAIPYMDEPWYC